jgi:dipeptidyl aminopeptidase/acylaminoacyl peptidase
VSAEGGAARQVTTVSTGAAQPCWSPDGSKIAFVSEVFPEFSARPAAESDSLNREQRDRRAKGPVKAKVFTRLLYRHWDHWVEGKRSHIFVQPVAGGRPADLTPGDRDAVPTSTTFSDAPDFVFSPDGREIVFTATPVPPEEEAWSTNHDLYAVSVEGGGFRQLTTNPAADAAPRFSPDGRYLAYIAQARPGFEADRWTLMLLEKGAKQPRDLTASFDASVMSPVWSHDGKTIFFLSDRNAEVGVFSVQTGGSQVHEVFVSGTNESLNPLPDGRGLVFSRSTAVRPAEIFRLQAGPRDSRAEENSRDHVPARLAQITRVNDSLFRRSTSRPPAASPMAARTERAFRDGCLYHRRLTLRRNIRSSCLCMAGRRTRGRTDGRIAGTRRSGRPGDMRCSLRTRGEARASARNSWRA